MKENFGEQLNQYENYLNDRNKNYQEYLDSKLTEFRKSIKEQEKNLFEEGLKDIIESSEKIKNTGTKYYKQEIQNAEKVNAKFLKDKIIENAEKELNNTFDLAKKMVDGFIRDFS